MDWLTGMSPPFPLCSTVVDLDAEPESGIGSRDGEDSGDDSDQASLANGASEAGRKGGTTIYRR